MKYNLKNKIQAQNFKAYANALYKRGALVELKIVRKVATLKQMRYLYLIFTWLACHRGQTVEEVKFDFKRYYNPEVFQYESLNKTTGVIEIYYKSVADSSIDTKIMTHCIERYRNKVVLEENEGDNPTGFSIPSPDDQNIHEWYFEVERTKELNKNHL